MNKALSTMSAPVANANETKKEFKKVALVFWRMCHYRRFCKSGANLGKDLID
jgi:hypothetical protein